VVAPVVSVIIPTYNRAHVLPRALDSVANQTYTDYEVIVVDDGSTDGTADLISTFAKLRGRISYIRVERNRGAAAARNRGIDDARGTYIAFLDADDEWAPTKLAMQVALFAAAPPEVGLITTRYILFDQAGQLTSVNPPHPKEGDLSLAMIDFIAGRQEIVGVFSTLMFKRSVIERVGRLDETLRCWEDADFYFRAARYFHFSFIPERLTMKYDSADSISCNWAVEAAGVRVFWEKYRDEVGAFPHFRRYIARHQHGMAVFACLEGNLSEGRRLFRESLAILPSQWHPVVHLALTLSGTRAYARILSLREQLRRTAA